MTTKSALGFSIHFPPPWLKDLKQHIPETSRFHSSFSEMCRFCWLKPKVYQVPPSEVLKEPFGTNSYSYVGTGQPPKEPVCTIINATPMLVRQRDFDVPSVTQESPAEEGTEADFPAPV